MVTVVKSRIVQVGNSQGIRIPKLLLEQANLGEEVELELQENQIVIRAVQYPRAGWDEQFHAMAEHGDDALLDGDALLATEWDTEQTEAEDTDRPTEDRDAWEW